MHFIQGLSLFLGFSFIFPSEVYGQWQQRLDDLVEGRPVLEKILGPQGYEEFPVYKLKNARLLWVNWSLLKDLGVEFTDEASRRQIEGQLLNRLAFANPAAGETLNSYDTQTKNVFADRYGGMGTGKIQSGGSGRAAS